MSRKQISGMYLPYPDQVPRVIRLIQTQCTGGIPCATCLKKRQKPRCVYRNVSPKDADADELLEDTFAEQDESDLPASATQPITRIKNDPDFVDDGNLVIPLGDFFGSLSLSRVVDEYRQSTSSESSGQDVIDSMLTAKALLATPTSGQGKPPTNITPTVATETSTPLMSTEVDPYLPKHIRYLYTKYLSICQMLDTGLVPQAWTTFPSLVREVDLYGLDEDHTAGERAPSHEITEASRRLWWRLLDLDLRLSLLVGRWPHLPSNAFDFPRPSFRGSRPDENRLRQSQFEFMQLKMDFLTCANTGKAQTSPISEDRQSREDMLSVRFERLQEGAPSPSQDGPKDLAYSIAVAEHQLDIHLFSILLHHYHTRVTSSEAVQPPGRDKPSTRPPKSNKARILRKHASDIRQKEIFQSARRVMELFDYIHTSDTSKSTLSWTHCFGAYSAALILGVARLRQDVDLPTDSSRIQQISKVFHELTTTMPALSIAQLASGPLETLATALGNLEQDRENPLKRESGQLRRSPKFSVQTQTTTNANKNKRARDADLLDTNPPRQPKAQRLETSFDERFPDEDTRFSTDTPVFDGRGHNVPDWTGASGHDQQYDQHGSSYRDVPMGSFEQSAQSFEQTSFPPSASTSFTGNEPMEYGNLDYSSVSNTGHHFNPNELWIRPPMRFHPPLYHPHWQAMWPMGTDGLQHSFYHDPSTMALNVSHPMDQQIHTQQSMMLNDMSHSGPGASLEESATGPGSAQPSLGPERAQPQHGARFYDAADDAQFTTVQHPSSSPIIGAGLMPHEGGFAHPADSSRRRSVADIRQPQRGAWNIETPSNYTEAKPRVKGKLSNEQSQTPTQDGILSPLSEGGPQSRRNSATPRMIAQQGMPNNLTHQLDFSLDGIRPPMTLPIDMMYSEEYPGSRRASLAARGIDPSINEVNANVNVSQQLATITETPSTTWQQGHTQPPPVSQQARFDTTGTMNYDPGMTNNHLAYNTQFHQHPQQQTLHHHPHLHHPVHHHSQHDFLGQARQVATTGPSYNDQRYWGR
ncbi:hypothetical protein LTR84_013001 [Exophiala bonariae]|uniref:Transcription factor domain-containing protein n=1 Tax=Exophiala bonariae TaxID=1690606 RepID=A0AAV9NDU8_9EURO|nr:hypothetical protein LTR84_013001 [Exophiala bonariae]